VPNARKTQPMETDIASVKQLLPSERQVQTA